MAVRVFILEELNRCGGELVEPSRVGCELSRSVGWVLGLRVGLCGLGRFRVSGLRLVCPFRSPSCEPDCVSPLSLDPNCVTWSSGRVPYQLRNLGLVERIVRIGGGSGIV
ncbi:hypothetical protein V6N13_048281 [Hibiscus sabdariffa]